MCLVETREICYITVGGKRRAVTPQEKRRHEAQRRQHNLEVQAAKAVARLEQEVWQEEWDAVVYQPTGTAQCGCIDPQQRVTRASFGRGPDWMRKDKHDRARGCGCGDKGLRAIRRATRRDKTAYMH